jgi:hypothetical protein
MHRLLLGSAAYRRTSASGDKAFGVDPENRLLWRYSLRRLDAESLRDAMLAVSGRLDRRFGGRYVPTTRDEFGEVLIQPDTPGALRRSIYLQQRRTQTVSLLGVFDSPTIVFNCIQRPASTMPLQSLSLLNANFVVSQAGLPRLAARRGDAEARVTRAFLQRWPAGGFEPNRRVTRVSAAQRGTTRGRLTPTRGLGRFLPDAAGEQRVLYVE